MHLHHVFRIPHSPQMAQNITESQILQNKSGFPPNGCQVSHSGHVVTVERWFVGSHGVYHCQWCLSVRDREKYIETGDQTFLNVILHHVRDDSGFSRPNVGRYLNVKQMSESWNGLRPIVGNIHAIFEVIWLNRFRVLVSDTCKRHTHNLKLATILKMDPIQSFSIQLFMWSWEIKRRESLKAGCNSTCLVKFHILSNFTILQKPTSEVTVIQLQRSHSKVKVTFKVKVKFKVSKCVKLCLTLISPVTKMWCNSNHWP